jgi:hypothetical protein
MQGRGAGGNRRSVFYTFEGREILLESGYARAGSDPA